MKNIESKMNEKKFRQVSRRELLKLTPVLALGAFAIPKWQEGLLKKGLGFSDWRRPGFSGQAIWRLPSTMRN